MELLRKDKPSLEAPSLLVFCVGGLRGEFTEEVKIYIHGEHVKVAQAMDAYFSILLSKIYRVHGLYAAVLVPALVNPALAVPSKVVLAPPRCARGTVCGVGFPRAHVQMREPLFDVVGLPLRLEELHQLISRVAALHRAPSAPRLRMWRYVDSRTCQRCGGGARRRRIPGCRGECRARGRGRV